MTSIVLLSILISFFAAYTTRWLAVRFQIVDAVRGGRKVHTQSTPLLGGLGIGLTILLITTITLCYLHPSAFDPLFAKRILGFLVGISILLIGGVLDDRYDLPPWLQVLFPTAAALSVMASGTSILEVSSLTNKGVLSLDWWHWSSTILGHVVRFVFPADALTLAWLLGVTYATKTLDGLDGLVTGQTIIGALLVILLAISPRFYQPDVVLVAAIILGAFIGFLPWNLSPARQFLGESGSTLAGFSLGFLAIVSGAKVATAFMALGIPLVDFLRVIVIRLRAGRSPFHGDNAHLHFQLLRLGFSQRQVAALFWMLALVFGLSALGLQTRGKIFLMVGLVALTFLLAFLAHLRVSLSTQARKGSFIFACLVTGIVSVWSVLGLWHEHAQRLSTQQVYLNHRPLWIELADTPQEREQGLSDRPSMRTDHGMLFIFPKPDIYGFWMPRMHFDLDIIWLNGSRVVDMVRLPAPHSPQEEPARYTPREPADRVLELVAGQSKIFGLEPGAEVPQLQIGQSFN